MKLTRRQILKIAAAAAVGMLDPAGVIGQVRKLKTEPQKAHPTTTKDRPEEIRVHNVMKRSTTDPGFRRLLLSNPDKALRGQGLTTFQQNMIKERVKLVTIVAFALALQIMRQRKSLRPLLLNPAKRETLLFGTGQIAAQQGISRNDTLLLDKTRVNVNDIYNEIFLMEPDIGIKIRPGSVGLSDTGCINNANCSTDSAGCTDDGCYDHWCDDNGCNNTGACWDERCANSGCTDQDSCSDLQHCSDTNECANTGQCIGMGNAIDSVIDGLVIKLEEALNKGPDLDFLVDVGQTRIQGETFLNPGAVHRSLSTVPRIQD